MVKKYIWDDQVYLHHYINHLNSRCPHIQWWWTQNKYLGRKKNIKIDILLSIFGSLAFYSLEEVFPFGNCWRKGWSQNLSLVKDRKWSFSWDFSRIYFAVKQILELGRGRITRSPFFVLDILFHIFWNAISMFWNTKIYMVKTLCNAIEYLQAKSLPYKCYRPRDK